MTTKKLAIIGAGGHAKVVADAALTMQKWHDIVFLDDKFTEQDKLLGFHIIGGLFAFKDKITPEEYDIALAIGDNHFRAALFRQAKQLGFDFPAIIHRVAVISPFARIDEGTVVFANAVVNAGARIGRGCIINTAAVAEHDCIVDDFVHLSPGVHLAGNTRIAQYCWLGIGSCTKQGIRIGRATTVGAGAVVIRDTGANVTVVGNPAGAINHKSDV